jgi:hypothetical protein
MQRAPHDPFPISMAAWCPGLRAGHHFTAHPEVEREAARKLAQRAARLNAGDPLAETMLPRTVVKLGSGTTRARVGVNPDPGAFGEPMRINCQWALRYERLLSRAYRERFGTAHTGK